jgi:hypothetical protein
LTGEFNFVLGLDSIDKLTGFYETQSFALFARLEQSRHLALRLDVGRNARAGSSRFG